MRCVAATACTSIHRSIARPLAPTTCSTCALDERPPQPCGTVTASGGQGTTRTRHALGPSAGTVRIAYDMYVIPDRLDCFYQDVLVATTGGLVAGKGELSWTYPARAGDLAWCLVVMSAPQDGTAWTYTLHCPTP